MCSWSTSECHSEPEAKNLPASTSPRPIPAIDLSTQTSVWVDWQSTQGRIVFRPYSPLDRPPEHQELAAQAQDLLVSLVVREGLCVDDSTVWL